jgi:hypothetical protein
MQGPVLELTQRASLLMVRGSEMSEVILLERVGSWNLAASTSELHERPQQAAWLVGLGTNVKRAYGKSRMSR